eukprot:scaffold51966_cov36-Cyclotella_meneghiniana.AAC.2
MDFYVFHIHKGVDKFVPVRFALAFSLPTHPESIRVESEVHACCVWLVAGVAVWSLLCFLLGLTFGNKERRVNLLLFRSFFSQRSAVDANPGFC